MGYSYDYVYDLPAFQAYAAAEAGKFPEGGGYHGARLTQLEIEQTPELTEALLKRGYSDEDVCDILSGNWLRVTAQVWR